ncbi:MAG: MFS transporter [Firmicutes bacterium]|nr:MFS transporter [Bacillota bacterium]
MTDQGEPKKTDTRNVLYFTTGGVVSLTGDSILMAAVLFFLARIPHAPLYLSLATLAFTAPRIVATLVGVYTDRLPLRATVALTRAVQGLVCLSLGVNFGHPPIMIGALILLELFATVNSVAGTALAAMIITPDQRATIIGRLHAAQTSVQLAGRLLGAALLEWLRPLGVGITDAVSFGIAMLGVLAIRLPKTHAERAPRASAWKSWGVGWQALYGDLLARRLLYGASATSLLLMPMQAYLSLVLYHRFHVNAIAYGAALGMEMAGGVAGGLIGPRILRWATKRWGSGSVFVVDLVGLGGVSIGVGVAPEYSLLMTVLCVMGFLQAFQNLTAPTYIMRQFSGTILGRVVGTITSLEAGASLIGSLALVWIGPLVRAKWILDGAGVLLVVTILVIFAVGGAVSPGETVPPRSKPPDVEASARDQSPAG